MAKTNDEAGVLGAMLQQALAAIVADSGKTKKLAPTAWDKLDVQIEHSGRAITLPAEPGNMPLEKAVEALQRRIKDEEQIFNVYEIIDAYPHDGAVAFYKAMQELYGFASPETTQTFFGPQPPQMLSIKTGPGLNDVVQCPIGKFRLPGVDKPIHAIFHNDDGKPVFLIHGEVKKRDRHILLELATRTREIVKRESIYRGKPIRLGVDDDGGLNLNSPPEFLDVSDISESHLLFNESIQSQINTNILVPLKETARCRQHKIPLKRGILLEGPYGCGKSLTARMTARVAEQNGWTFVLLDNVSGLKAALEFANRYAPAIVFAEDIDRVASERDEDANDLINMIDGVVSKTSEIMIVLTTNFVEKLDPVILRPGRLDAVISILAPDRDTVQKLMRYYAGDLLSASEDLTEAGAVMAGQIPASIRECVEKAKLGMIGRKANKISNQDLVVAGRVMQNHLNLLNRKAAEVSAGDKLAGALRDVVNNGSGAHLEKIEHLVKEVHSQVGA